MSAVLIIGDVSESLRLADGDAVVRRVSTADEFRAVYDEFAFLEVDAVVVLYDVSLLRGSARFAKFLEESRNRVLCLASRDNLDEMTMSRFSRVVKRPGATRFSGSTDRSAAAEEYAAGAEPVDAAAAHDPTAVPALLRVRLSRYWKRLSELALAEAAR